MTHRCNWKKDLNNDKNFEGESNLRRHTKWREVRVCAENKAKAKDNRGTQKHEV